MEDNKTPNINENKDESNDSSLPQFRGLYRKVKISVKTLDKIIIVLLIALVACIAYGILNDNGFTITFNSQGGSYIEPLKKEYLDKINVNNPTRDGYRFNYWSFDETCESKVDLDTYQIESDITLYACWLEE